MRKGAFVNEKAMYFRFSQKIRKIPHNPAGTAQLCGMILCNFENKATHATMAAMTQNATRHTTVITEQTPEARV